MVKCVVSSCPNREVDRCVGRTPKRFFCVPQDPARVKVWLAALREPDAPRWSHAHVICEDHFLPEDVTAAGVSPDAIPIMPPCLEPELAAWAAAEDGEDGWAAEDQEDGWAAEDQEDGWAAEDQEDGWAAEDRDEGRDETREETHEAQEEETGEAEEETGEAEEETGEADEETGEAEEETGEAEEETRHKPHEEKGEEAMATDETHTVGQIQATGPPAGRSPPQPPGCAPEGAPEPLQASSDRTSSSPRRLLAPSWEHKKSFKRNLSLLALQFLELLLHSDGSLDLHQAAATLQTQRRRIYDVMGVMRSLDLLRKEAHSRVRWTGRCSISSLLWQEQKMQKEAQKMKLVEETLDGLIKSCSQQLFEMTDDQSNARSAYVTFSDVQNLPAFQNQTVIVVRAPEETKLEVPAPKPDSIQIHLKSASGPISALACDVWPGGTAAGRGSFLQLQHSRVRTSLVRTADHAHGQTTPTADHAHRQTTPTADHGQTTPTADQSVQEALAATDRRT